MRTLQIFVLIFPLINFSSFSNSQDPPPQPPQEPRKPTTTKKPTSRVKYEGNKIFGDWNCLLAHEIDKIQRSHVSTETKTNVLNEKGCKWEDFLECHRSNRTHNRKGEKLATAKETTKCECMKSRLGAKAVEIEKKCYIPAGMGKYSRCVIEKEDRYTKYEWGKINNAYDYLIPQCVPKAICRKTFMGFRCECRDERHMHLDRENGTCSETGKIGEYWSQLKIITSSLVIIFLILSKLD